MKKKTDLTAKPYNRCLSCHHRQVSCDGPRTSAMELERWCEFMRDMKELNGMTNADVAEKSGVSIKRVEQLMALNAKSDIMRETARLIENAIIGSSNQYPCYLAFEETLPADNTQALADAMKDLERALNDNKDYREALDNIHASYKAELQAIRDDAEKEKQAIRDDAQKRIDILTKDLEKAREMADAWRYENDRKGKLIDKYLDKMIAK